MRRVVISGIGIISAIGNDKVEFFESLLAGRSGIRRIVGDLADRSTVRVAAQVDFDRAAYASIAGRPALDRFSEFALAAAAGAVADARLALHDGQRDRAGIYFGTGMGGAHTMEDGYVDLYRRNADRLNPFTVLAGMNNAAAAQIGLVHGLRGPCLTYSCACASSAIAIGEAYRAIKHGYVSVALAGGSEALLTYGTLKAWECLRTLAPENSADPAASCRPFSKDRCGLVLGEGAAAFLLEELDEAEERGAPILAEIIGYGLSNDAYHLTKPSIPGQARAMAAALEDADIRPDGVDYINAHGTGTVVGDKVETEAIKAVFGPSARRIPVSSTKSMHGHLMGAAGAVEFAAAVLAIANRAAPPTAHLHHSDPECDLDYVPVIARRAMDIKTVMSNSFAFGGSNAVLVARSL